MPVRLPNQRYDAAMPNQCVVRWNPGVWPYVTRCILVHPHEDMPHRDLDGAELINIVGQVERENENPYPCEGAEYGVCGGSPHTRDCPSYVPQP